MLDVGIPSAQQNSSMTRFSSSFGTDAVFLPVSPDEVVGLHLGVTMCNQYN